jgi:hypothetical protein
MYIWGLVRYPLLILAAKNVIFRSEPVIFRYLGVRHAKF